MCTIAHEVRSTSVGHPSAPVPSRGSNTSYPTCTPSRSITPTVSGSSARITLPLLRTCLVDVVQWRLRHPPETGEPGVGRDLPHGGLACLGPEAVSAGLGAGVGYADERGESVVRTADRVEVVRNAVARAGLDHHPRAVVGDRGADAA